jgi:Saxitoxin biosynthesis operon protein SxtJ
MAPAVSARLTEAEGRKFAFTVGAACVVLAAAAWWRGRPTAGTVLGSVGVLLLAAGLTVPAQLGPVQRAWMGLAHAISKVTTPVFLGAVFFLAITPIGWLKRRFGSRPLRRPPGPTAWITRAPDARRGLDMHRQF